MGQHGACSNLVVKALCYNSEGHGFETQHNNDFFFNLPNPSAAIGPGVHSASNRNEYEKHKSNVSWGVERGRCVGLTNLRPSVSQLSRQCGILNISQPYRPSWPVTYGTAFHIQNYRVFGPCPLSGILRNTMF
jgi:hypothetical protein